MSVVRRADQRQKPLVFMHIGKVGGYSISQELFSRFPIQRIFNGSAEQYDACDPEDIRDNDLFVGHFSWRQMGKIPKPSFLFSMVRDPVDRVVSNYFFLRGSDPSVGEPMQRRLVELARELDLADYIEHPEAVFAARDHQTYFFADDWRAQRTLPDALSLARDHSESFDLVGIFESYDDSMQTLCSMLGWKPWPSDVRLNTTRERRKVDQLPASVVARIQELNEQEIAFCDHLKRRFELVRRDTMRRLVHAGYIVSRTQVESQPPKAVDVFADAALDGTGWYPREKLSHAYVRWLGPHRHATVSIGVDRSEELTVDVYIKGWTSRAALDSLSISADGVPLERIAYNIDSGMPDQQSCAMRWLVPEHEGPNRERHLDLEFSTDRSEPLPDYSKLGGDSRLGSIALNAVRVYPANARAARSSDPLQRGIDMLHRAAGRVGMIVEAEGLFRDAAQHAPDDPRCHYWIAEAICYQGRLPDAVEHLEKSIALDEASGKQALTDAERGHLHGRLGEAFLQEDRDHVAASVHLRQAVEYQGEAANTHAINSAVNLLKGVLATTESERSRKFARWPVPVAELADLKRAIGHVVAGIEPLSPPITSRARAVTLGSCFAMNLGHALERRGLGVKMLGMGELINSTFANRALMEWIGGEASGVCDASVVDVLKAYFGDDPHEVARHFASADLVIYTLGVAPGFFDRKNGKFHLSQSGASTRHLLRQMEYRTTTVEENVDNLGAIVATLRRLQPNVQIMFSVSPVPLFSSFEYPSAIVADCVSKSTLRTSIDVLLKRRLEGVHYWPAFEIVRWLGAYSGPMFGEEDGTTRHVSGRVVDAIMDAFFSVHGSDTADVPERMTA